MILSQRTTKMLRWAPAVLFILAVLFISTRKLPRSAWHIDKIAHFLIYSVMCVLVFLPLSRNGHRHPYILSLVTVLAIGMLDETIQYYNPARVASLNDFLADCLGAWSGLVINRGSFDASRSGS